MSKKTNFFWASYADLMTSLFFIMLVLFVLTIVMLKKEQGRIIAKLEEYEKIDEIKKTIESIDSSYFEYRPEYKKHILKLVVQFPDLEYRMSSINNNPNSKFFKEIEAAGRSISNTISQFTSDDNIQYLVIIEGQASLDDYYTDDYHNNDVLSYQRALDLKKFWEGKGIYLDRIENCELIVAGSGQGGIPREQPDRDNKKNQRFLIHIIPKTGEIENRNQ